MRLFEVRAIRRGAGVSTLVLNAASPEEAATNARQQGYSVIRVKRARPSLSWPSGSATIPLALFSQELLTLLESGLSVVEAIETLKEKASKSEQQRLLAAILKSLYEGASFSQALEQAGPVFPALYVATVRASEKSGNLVEALGRYIAYQSQFDLLKKKIASAAIYPAVLTVAGLGVVAFLLGYVVPRFARIFEDMGEKVPLMSRLLIRWGSLVHEHGIATLLGSSALVAGLVVWASRPASRRWLFGQLTKISVIGENLRVYQLARFYRTVGMLLRGGMPILTALSMAEALLQGSLRQGLADASRAIREGLPISVAMEQAALTTPVSLRMLRVGERTGQMGEMMERIARFYDDEIARWVDWFVRLFEPVLMAFIGLVVGGIVVMMYFPIFELAGSLQ